MKIDPKDWKWLVATPLAPRWRDRLELCFGLVVSVAAAVALGAALPPDPSKLARHAPVVAPSAVTAGSVARTPAEPPSVTSAFMTAVREGDVRAMNRHYAPGMPLDGMLVSAAQSGNKAAVAWLLAHGADIHEGEGTWYAPMLAADAHPDIVALLRASGAKEPELEAAAAAAAPNAVFRLLDAHPNLDERGANPLLAAATSQNGRAQDKWRIVTRLLELGADPNRGEGGSSVLGGVVLDCDREGAGDCMPIVELALEHGARVTGDALGAALSLDESVRARPLDLLLAQPLAKGVTAVALAAATRASARDVERVVAKGIDWAWQDGEEDAALPVMSAVRRGDRDMLRTFLDAGAPVDQHYKDASSALAEAIDGGGNPAQARIVELLVSRGANVNRRLPDGRTPLFAAAESGDLRVVTFLLARGARVNELVLDDMPLDVADQNGHTAVARVLHAHGARRNRARYPI